MFVLSNRCINLCPEKWNFCQTPILPQQVWFEQLNCFPLSSCTSAAVCWAKYYCLNPPDTWHVIRDTWWGVTILSRFQLPSSISMIFMISWRLGGNGWPNELINQLITRLLVELPGYTGLLKMIYQVLRFWDVLNCLELSQVICRCLELSEVVWSGLELSQVMSSCL